MNDLLYLFLASIFISLVSFGGGAQALFYQTSVTQHNWLSSADLSSVLAVGYATPGPAVFGTATFIGYHLGGIFGAIVGSIGIFIMPFLLAAAAAKYLSHLLENRHAQGFIKGVGLSAAGLVAATGLHMLEPYSMSPSPGHLVIALAAFVITLYFKSNPLYVLSGGALLGLMLR